MHPAPATAVAARSYPNVPLGDELAACAYIRGAKWPIFKVVFRVEAKAFSHWIIPQWIDLVTEKRMPFRTSRNSSWFDFGEFLKYAKNEFEMGSSSPSNDASVPPTWSIHYWSDRYETSSRCSLRYSLQLFFEFSCIQWPRQRSPPIYCQICHFSRLGAFIIGPIVMKLRIDVHYPIPSSCLSSFLRSNEKKIRAKNLYFFL